MLPSTSFSHVVTASHSQAHMGRDMAGYLSSNGFKAMVEPLASQQNNEKVPFIVSMCVRWGWRV